MTGIPASQSCNKSLLHTLRIMNILEPKSGHVLSSPNPQQSFLIILNLKFKILTKQFILISVYGSTLPTATRLSKHVQIWHIEPLLPTSGLVSSPVPASPYKPQVLHTNPIRSLCFLTTLSLSYFWAFVRCCFLFNSPPLLIESLWIYPLRPTSSGTSSQKPFLMSSPHLLYPHMERQLFF